MYLFRATRTLAGLFAIALVLACSGSENPIEPPPGTPEIFTLSIEGPAVIRQGQVVRYFADLRDGNGTRRNDVQVTWTSDAPGTVSIDPTGAVEAIAIGTTTLRASARGAEAERSVEVWNRRVADIQIDPELDLLVRESFALTAVAIDSARVEVPNSALQWSVRDPEVARVDSLGVVTGLAGGETRVTVAADEVSNGVVVRVSEHPFERIEVSPKEASIVRLDTLRFAVSGWDTTGAPRAVSFADWELIQGAGLHSGGVLIPTEAGELLYEVRRDGLADTARVTVRSRPAAIVQFSPDSMRIVAGLPARASRPSVVDDQFQVIEEPAIEWTVVDGAELASIDEQGVITGRREGRAVVQASVDGATDSLFVRIQPALQGPIRVLPEAATLNVGEAFQFEVLSLSTAGDTLPTDDFTWSVDNPGLASVDPSGLVTALFEGSTRVAARNTAGAVAWADLTIVDPDPFVEVTYEGAIEALPVGASRQLRVIGRRASGVRVEVPSTWAVTDPTIASISESNVLTGIAPGSGTLSVASNFGGSAFFLEVVAEPVDSLALDPLGPMYVGQAISTGVTAFAADGRTLAESQMTWRTEDPSIATANPAGIRTTVQAVSRGVTELVVSAHGVEARTRIEVLGGEPVTLEIQPDSIRMAVRDSVRLTARLLDARGEEVTPTRPLFGPLPNSVTRVDSLQNIIALGQGRRRMTFTRDGVQADVDVEVGPRIVEVFQEASAERLTVLQGRRVPLPQVLLRDEEGNVLDDPRWLHVSVEAPSLAEVVGDSVRGLGPGETRIRFDSYDGRAADTLDLVIEEERVAEIQISGGIAAAVPGDSLQLVAEVLNQLGRPFSGEVGGVWSSDDPSIATVDSAGWVRLLAPGSVDIRYTVGVLSGTTRIEVSPGRLATVLVTPSLQEAVLGDTVTFTATGLDAVGNEVALEDVHWASQVHEEIAPGVFVVRRFGTWEVRATSGATIGLALISARPERGELVSLVGDSLVLEVGELNQMPTAFRSSSGLAMPGNTPRIEVLRTDVAAGALASGVIGVGAGETFLTSTVDDQLLRVPVRVFDPNATTVRVSESGFLLEVGQSQGLTAQVLDGRGAELVRTVEWSTSDTTVVVVDTAGRVTAMGSGRAAVTASVDGASAATQVAVDDPAAGGVASLRVQLTTRMWLQGSYQTDVFALDGSGATVTSRRPVLTSSDPAVVSVDGAGLVTAHGVGRATITAAVDGVSESVEVEVAAIIGVPASAVRVPIGTERETGAYFLDEGRRLTDPGAVTIEVVDAPVAVGADGRIRGLSEGSGRIRVISGWNSKEISIDVRPAETPVTFEFIGGSQRPRPGQDYPLRGLLRAFDWADRDIPVEAVTWRSLTPDTATVNGEGLLTMLVQGHITVEASYRGVTATVHFPN